MARDFLQPRRGRRETPLTELPLKVSKPPAVPLALRQLLFETLLGRVFVIALAARLLVAVLGLLVPLPGVLQGLGSVATLLLLGCLAIFAVRLFVRVKRRLLWRVRRRLILSYLFFGFVPALLIVAFFLFGGLLMFLNVSSYLFRDGFDDVVNEARAVAEASALELQRVGGGMPAASLATRKQLAAAERLPGLSIAVAPTTPAGAPMVATGPWRHLEPPRAIPAWVSRAGFGGILAVRDPDGAETGLVVRAVGFPDEREPQFGVVADVPVDDEVAQRLREATGIELGDVAVVPIGGDTVRPATGRMDQAATFVRRRTTDAGSKYLFNWVTFFDYVDWESGQSGKVSLATRVSLGEIYDRITGAQSRIGNVNLGDLFLLALGVIAVLFLVIEAIAFAMGFALARSITGAVHELFTGTERVRRGDFTHRIPLQTDDQLGELADSFNAMTASIEELMQQAAEKKRLEEELRIAREIQMSLLPRGVLAMPGLAVTALCVPAREVGGDYYDFFPLSGHRVGILIADVSGKGTSAALYMAELKGLVLSLSEIYQSPKRLLVEANRIISANLDARSFITMTYVVLDLEQRVLTYARAGHTPLIHVPSAHTGSSEARVLAPDGMVLGLRIDGMEDMFEQVLEECRLPIATGDVVVLFTDGITEAMNEHEDLFGEGRLSRLVEEHGHLTSEELRERILRDVQAFQAGADQHDDMTMILVKIEDVTAWSAGARPAAAAAV